MSDSFLEEYIKAQQERLNSQREKVCRGIAKSYEEYRELVARISEIERSIEEINMAIQSSYSDEAEDA